MCTHSCDRSPSLIEHTFTPANAHLVTYTLFHTNHTQTQNVLTGWPHAHLPTNIYHKPSGTLRRHAHFYTHMYTHIHTSSCGPTPTSTSNTYPQKCTHAPCTWTRSPSRRLSTRSKHLVSSESGRQTDRWDKVHSCVQVALPTQPQRSKPQACPLTTRPLGRQGWSRSGLGRSMSELPGADSIPGADSLVHS